MQNPVDQLERLASGIPPAVWQTALAVASAALALYVAWQLKRGLATLGRRIATSGSPGEDILTVIAASIATGVSAQGMWRFAGDVLNFDGPLRFLLFAFIEVAMVTSAVRARRNMRETQSAGIDGAAVWALTGLSAVLSSMDARSLPEAVFRLAAPLVAAWLWERGMAIERRRATGLGGINWRITPERVLVRLGLAEARGRTTSEVDAHRRLTRVALAAKRARTLRQAGATGRKMRAALARLDRALDKAVEHTGLARDQVLQGSLLDQVTTLYGGASLLDLPSTPPWEHADHPAVTGMVRHSEAVMLAAALNLNTTARLGGPAALPVATGDRSATTPATGRDETGDHPAVADEPLPPSPEGRSWLATLALRSRPETRPVAESVGDHQAVAEPVADPVAEPVADSGVVATGRGGGRDRSRPDEQDKRRAVRFWIGRAKKGQPPSKRELADWTGFSETWALGCIQEARQTMINEGWVFDDKGAPTAPRPVAEPVATTPARATANGNVPGGEA